MEEFTPTLDASNAEGMSALQANRVRRLLPVECERLQGFPDGYTDVPGAADGPRYRALGNSMAVPVMGWIGARIIGVAEIVERARSIPGAKSTDAVRRRVETA